MTAFTDLAAMVLTSTEQSTVQAAVGYEDATGMLSSVNADLADIVAKLNRLATYVPSGSNLTKIQAAVTALA